ncbi:MAG: chemotaxis response regulator protein-glutamate methylesterase [Oceanococcaceae bacterium]
MAISILIVDDSALARHVLTEILSKIPDFKVLGAAQDPLVARGMIKELNPDVITLDVEMPRMDGLVFLENLMRLRPTPVIMVSSLTTRGADVTLRALELGAVDFVAKPALGLADGLRKHAGELAAKIRIAANARVQPLTQSPGQSKPTLASLSAKGTGYRTTHKVIAMGASTGGTEALREVIQVLPADMPAIVVTQHIPESFSRPFADRMNKVSAMTVLQAEDQSPILPGHVYVAPGSHHMEVVRSGARWLVRLLDTPPVNRHRPAVDVMFDSVVDACGTNAMGVLLTGMGADGAQGLLRLRQGGAHTVAQDEESSVVWGMPGAAVKLGAAAQVLNLRDIPQAMLDWVRGSG